MEQTIESPRPLRVLRLQEVESRTGLRRSAIYQHAGRGTFPKPIRLGGKAAGWIESEVEAWITQRIAARDAQASSQERAP